MKVILLILVFLFIQAAVSQVTRQNCLDAGITDSSLPETFPVATTATDGPCSDNACCTSDYIDKLADNIRNNIFKECIRDTFSQVIEIATEFFDNFADLFGSLGRNALFSSFSARAEIGDDTRDVYIDNELSYFSELLANITFARIRGDTDTSDFKFALREYACGFVASLVQKNFYSSTLRTGRISGSCLCRLTIPDSTNTVGNEVDTIIDATISRFTSTIDNILRLLRAINTIRTVSIQNLNNALDYDISSLCSRQYINAVACRHCEGTGTRGCYTSCRLVSLFCLQPLSDALSKPYASFIEFVTLSLSTIVGNNSDSIGAFDLHDVQEIAGLFNKQLTRISSVAMSALSASILRDDTLEDNTCFISRVTDIEDGRVICKNDTDVDKKDYVTYCRRVDGDKVIVDVNPDLDRDDASDSSDPDTRTPEAIETDDETESDSDSDDFERTNDERDFEKFVQILSNRFRVFGNFNLIYNKISKCVCRASSDDRGSSGPDSGRDDDAGEDRLTTLFISQSQPCFERYEGNPSPRGLEDNPAFQSLTSSQQTQVRTFDATVSSMFTDLEQTVANDPSTSATFSQLMGEASGAGRILTSFIFVIFSSLLTVLIILV